MDIFGITLSYLLVQILNLLLLVGWLVAAVVALIRLRGRDLPPNAQAIWAALIVIVPILGAVAFFLVRPGTRQSI